MSVFHFMLRAIIPVILVLGAAYQARSAEPAHDAKPVMDHLLRLVAERLAIASDVAEAKWNSGDSIDAPAREAKILDRVVVEATRAGIDESFALEFFRHQFDASKIIQHRLHDRWERMKHPPFDAPPSLAEDIRPKLDHLTPQLIDSLRDFKRITVDASIRRYIENRSEILINDGIGGTARGVALRPLLEASVLNESF
ncbi:gamma subclass chorismate mutase AroQ [Salinicola halimionae]|uniref:gamma subclass chorismate mutase AroQ n=1 Tax=Salinicola halimionae TaxID=1949081 RepID=UPI001FD9266F|nr:gamma subclass chorismate mutase AroQ [Salinicola halimionae]